MKYEQGDTIFLEGEEYLILEELENDLKKYLLLGSRNSSFELVFCEVKDFNKEEILEVITDESLKEKLLERIGK